MGYKILLAEDGLEAIELFKAHQNEIALIVLDAVMPHCGGVQLAMRIREIKPDIPVVFATGYDKEHVFGSSNQIKNSEVLTKPFQFDTLSHVIKDKLGS